MSAAGPGELVVEGLSVDFGGAAAVRDVSFTLAPGQCVALVGESGSGKSVTARALLGLSGGGVRASRIELDGRSLLGLGEREWRRIRGPRIGLVLQDALVSLDPLRPIGREIDDALRLHSRLTAKERRDRVLEVLSEVGMPDPAVRRAQGSDQLSGGLRQRALIAAALALRPGLVIADEPTTALDAQVQRQVVDRLARIRDEGGAVLAISHDLQAVRRLADHVVVMRAGRVVEQGPVAAILDAPREEYTRALVAALPAGKPRGTRLSVAAVLSVPDAAAPAAVPREGENGPDASPSRPETAHSSPEAQPAAPVPTSAVPREGENGPDASPSRPEPAHSAPGATPAVPPVGKTGPNGGASPPETAHSAPGAAPVEPAPVPAPAPAATVPRVGENGADAGASRPESAHSAPRARARPGAPRAAAALRTDVVLRASGLTRTFGGGAGIADVSFELHAGQTLGLVGASGSGKTTSARLLLGLDSPDAGTVELLGAPWNPLPERERRARRSELGAIYQDPASSFDPRWTVGRILADSLTRGRRTRAVAGSAAVTTLLEEVGLDGSVAARRPATLSGGQRQRVAIARALAPRPRLIVCDEPVSSLDVTVQAQVLDLLDDLQREHGLAYLFISHDLDVVRHQSDHVAVMADGRIVEQAPTEQLFAAPQHAYTRALLAAAG